MSAKEWFVVNANDRNETVDGPFADEETAQEAARCFRALHRDNWPVRVVGDFPAHVLGAISKARAKAKRRAHRVFT